MSLDTQVLHSPWGGEGNCLYQKIWKCIFCKIWKPSSPTPPFTRSQNKNKKQNSCLENKNSKRVFPLLILPGGKILCTGWNLLKFLRRVSGPPPLSGGQLTCTPPSPLHHLFLSQKCELFLFHLPFSLAFVLPMWGPLISWTRETRKRDLENPEVPLSFKLVSLLLTFLAPIPLGCWKRAGGLGSRRRYSWGGWGHLWMTEMREIQMNPRGRPRSWGAAQESWVQTLGTLLFKALWL